MATKDDLKRLGHGGSAGVTPIRQFPKFSSLMAAEDPREQRKWLLVDEEIEKWRKSIAFASDSGGTLAIINRGTQGGGGFPVPGSQGVPGTQGSPGSQGPQGIQGPPGIANSIRTHVWIAWRTDGIPGTGVEHDPYDGSSVLKLDQLLRGLPINTTIHFGPGVFETQGAGVESEFPVKHWRPRTGWVIIGSGIGVTTLKLVNTEIDDSYYWLISNVPLKDGMINDVEIRDLTLDCNIQGQSAAVAVGGFWLHGNRIKIERLQITNWGSQGLVFLEAFACGGGNASPNFGNLYDMIIDGVIINNPGFSTGPTQIGTMMAFGGYDNNWAYDSATLSLSVQTVTADLGAVRHGMKPGQWFRVIGADQADYNGSFQVASVINQFKFTYLITGSPASPTGTIAVQHPQEKAGGTGHLHGLVIQNCTLDGEDWDVALNGIAASGNGAIVRNNVIRNVTSPFYMDSFSGESLIFHHNVISNCERGIHIGLAGDGPHFDKLAFNDNLIELALLTTRGGAEAYVKGSNTWYLQTPYAFSVIGTQTTRPLTFTRLTFNGNVVRYVGGVGNSSYPAKTLLVQSVDTLEVRDNVIDLYAAGQMQTSGTVNTVIARNNRRSDGTWMLIGKVGSSASYFDPDVERDSTMKVALLGV